MNETVIRAEDIPGLMEWSYLGGQEIDIRIKDDCPDELRVFAEFFTGSIDVMHQGKHCYEVYIMFWGNSVPDLEDQNVRVEGEASTLQEAVSAIHAGLIELFRRYESDIRKYADAETNANEIWQQLQQEMDA